MIRQSLRWLGMVGIAMPFAGCAVVHVPPNAATIHGISEPSRLPPSQGTNEYDGCFAVCDDLQPVKPELIPSRLKEAGFQLYARTTDWKDRCRIGHAAACEGWKSWFHAKVRPPKEPPWPKFHPIPAAPAFTPREDEVEESDFTQG